MGEMNGNFQNVVTCVLVHLLFGSRKMRYLNYTRYLLSFLCEGDMIRYWRHLEIKNSSSLLVRERASEEGMKRVWKKM